MELKLIRETYTDDSTIGKLYVNDVFHCFTLEDKVRAEKIKSITAIPAGRYKVVVDFSNRFKQLMPLLLNVPNYLGVRIHWGNYSKDSDGCILVGSTKAVNFIGNSRTTYAKLLSTIQKALKTEQVFITIIDTK